MNFFVSKVLFGHFFQIHQIISNELDVKLIEYDEGKFDLPLLHI